MRLLRCHIENFGVLSGFDYEFPEGLAVICLTIGSFTIWIRAINSINVVGILRAGGDTVFSMLLDTMALWVVGVPLVGIAALVSLSDCATANNTVAIVLSGSMAKDISREYGVDPRRLMADNGVPAQTVDPRSTDGYSIINGVYIKNKSSRTLDPAVLGDRQFAACPQQGPQVLIVHSHASESYTMPPGQEYVPSGTFRTADRSCNMVRVGDELAAELSSYGISVVHDRTLHDGESYNDAYENSLASIQSYLAKYPSIVYVLDLHRDAVQDANGTQYKLVTAEDPAAAQVSLIMGVAHDGWQDNLRLAIAVQEKLESQSPTLMRPITLLNYRYNQFAAPGSLLVEVGAAGNSLDEALRAARLFAKGFAETILGR